MLQEAYTAADCVKPSGKWANMYEVLHLAQCCRQLAEEENRVEDAAKVMKG